MTLFAKEDKKLFHIHIPRVGGRYIKQVLSENGYELFHDNYEDSIYGISTMHLHYPLYEWLDGVNESKHFTVIRNPFTRFASAAHCMINEWYSNIENQIYSSLENKNELEYFINYHAAKGRYNSNWLRPQNEFLSEKTLVYRYEDGLGKNFIDWFNNNFDDNLEHRDYSYYADPNELKENKIKGNKKIESLIEQYYAKDYELLGY
jgi:hypothetical protein